MASIGEKNAWSDSNIVAESDDDLIVDETKAMVIKFPVSQTHPHLFSASDLPFINYHMTPASCTCPPR